MGNGVDAILFLPHKVKWRVRIVFKFNFNVYCVLIIIGEPLPLPRKGLEAGGDESQKIYDSVPRTEEVFNLNKGDLQICDKIGMCLGLSKLKWRG